MKKAGKRILRAVCLCLCVILLTGTACAEAGKELLDDHELMKFYDSSLFVGDSQIKNLGNYFRKLRKKDPEFFPTTKCYGAYSLQMKRLAQKSPTSNANDVQLTYKGRNATLTSIAKAENPRNVFIMIGLNDRIYDHMDRAERYFDQILELRNEYFPETRIWFLSITPVTNKRKEKERDKINQYNDWLREKCEQSDATYLDIRAGLTDEDGWMPKSITTDADCHFNDKGFDIFIGNLLDIAQAQYEAGLWEPAAQ